MEACWLFGLKPVGSIVFSLLAFGPSRLHCVQPVGYSTKNRVAFLMCQLLQQTLWPPLSSLLSIGVQSCCSPAPQTSDLVGDITHLWKVQDFVLELDNLGKLQAARPDSKVCEAMLDNFCTRLSAIQEWTSQNVLEIMDKVGSMALPETWKDKILEQLDLLGSHMQSHLRLQATPQRVSNLAAYLTEEEWSKLSQCSNHEAMQVLAQRMKHLGMVSLKESSKREAIALLLHMQVDVQQKPEPSSKMVKSLVNDFADLFKRMPAPPGAPASLPTYPPDPTALPAEFRMKAYPGQPPANKQVSLGIWLQKARLCQS